MSVFVRVGERAGVGSPQGRGETRWSCHARMAESVSVRGNGAGIIGNQLPMKNRGLSPLSARTSTFVGRPAAGGMIVDIIALSIALTAFNC